MKIEHPLGELISQQPTVNSQQEEKKDYSPYLWLGGLSLLAYALLRKGSESKKENPIPLTKYGEEWAEESNEGIAYYKIHPMEFLKLTTNHPSQIKEIIFQARSMSEYNKHLETTPDAPPYLLIGPNGQIYGHEGRHRAASILNAGEYEIEIALIAKEGKYSHEQFGRRWHRELPIPSILKAEKSEEKGDTSNHKHKIDMSKITRIPRELENPIEEKYNVPQELLDKYCDMVKGMEKVKFTGDMKLYQECDRRREAVHDEIIKAAGAKRDDLTFMAWLAQYVESVVYAEQNPEEGTSPEALVNREENISEENIGEENIDEENIDEENINEENPKAKLLAASSSIEGITKLVSEYYGKSKTVFLKEVDSNLWEVHNSKGLIDSVEVVLQKDRFRFQEKLMDENKNPKPMVHTTAKRIKFSPKAKDLIIKEYYKNGLSSAYKLMEKIMRESGAYISPLRHHTPNILQQWIYTVPKKSPLSGNNKHSGKGTGSGARKANKNLKRGKSGRFEKRS
jgi:hypothetical protein